MSAGRVNVLLSLQRFEKPVYRPKWWLYVIGASLWAVILWLVL
jgi:hypothetical protein